MSLQTKVNGTLVAGIVGEFSDTSPKSARAYLTYGKTDSDLPVFGKMFSFERRAINPAESSAKTDVAKQGAGTSTWTMGILVNPKESYTIGFTSSRTLPKQGLSATIATRGHIWVMSSTKTRAGAEVYTNENGDLGDSTLTGTKVKVIGARWMKTVAGPVSPATEVLSEVEIDNPIVASDAGGESV